MWPFNKKNKLLSSFDHKWMHPQVPGIPMKVLSIPGICHFTITLSNDSTALYMPHNRSYQAPLYLPINIKIYLGHLTIKEVIKKFKEGGKDINNK